MYEFVTVKFTFFGDLDVRKKAKHPLFLPLLPTFLNFSLRRVLNRGPPPGSLRGENHNKLPPITEDRHQLNILAIGIFFKFTSYQSWLWSPRLRRRNEVHQAASPINLRLETSPSRPQPEPGTRTLRLRLPYEGDRPFTVTVTAGLSGSRP